MVATQRLFVQSDIAAATKIYSHLNDVKRFQLFIRGDRCVVK